jgi:putative endonuclease
MKQPAVYILASARNGTLYIGVTSNLAGRIEAHRTDAVDGFTKKYEAIQREKRLKKWNRAWKIRLIEESNPDWADLSNQIY